MKLKRNSYFTFFVILPLCAIVVAALITGLIIRPLIAANSNNNGGGTIVDNPGENPTKDPEDDDTDNPKETPPNEGHNKIEMVVGSQKIHLVQLGVFSSLDGAKQHQSKLSADNINSFTITVDDKYRLIHSLFFDSAIANQVKEQITTAVQGADVFASPLDIPEKKLEFSYDTGDAAKIKEYTEKIFLDLSKYCDVIFQYRSNLITQQFFLTEITKLNDNNKSNIAYIVENSSKDTQHLKIIKGFHSIIQSQNPDNNIEDLAKTLIEIVDIYINLPGNAR